MQIDNAMHGIQHTVLCILWKSYSNITYQIYMRGQFQECSVQGLPGRSTNCIQAGRTRGGWKRRSHVNMSCTVSEKTNAEGTREWFKYRCHFTCLPRVLLLERGCLLQEQFEAGPGVGDLWPLLRLHPIPWVNHLPTTMQEEQILK